jgi:UDP-N-acetylglucosamine diphosphorylase/glucosamine-1-phosphate N-acetyltransferase
LEEVWDIIRLLPEQLSDDIAFFQRRGSEETSRAVAPPAHATIIGAHPVLVAADGIAGESAARPGATIEPNVVLDASAGPIWIGAGSTVHAFSRLVGPCYVGRQSSVLGDRVAASSIGDTCKVRGEMSNTIMLGYANKGHDGFVGHSYLGRWVNLGAGTITSNLKNTYGTVALWTPDGVRDSRMQFLGTLFGDHSKTGIGTCLNTGTVLGAGANVHGGTMPPKVIPPFAWGSAPPYSVYHLGKFLDVAARVMERRHVTLSAKARQQLSASHAARWTAEADE